MKSVCNFDNVMGKMLGMREAEGLDVGLDVLETIDNSGKDHFNDTVNQWGGEVYDAAPVREGDASALKGVKRWVGDTPLLHVVKSNLQDVRNPSGLFGEERVKPVIDFITEHYGSGEERAAYMDEIGYIFDEIDTSDMDPTLQQAWNKYRRFYEDGGELYGQDNRSGIEKVVGNAVGNTIKSSPKVIVGNVLEGVIKLPTLYPKTFLPGMAEAIKQGVFKKLPELERQGIYGHFQAGETLGKWEGLIGLTDVPLKNISYFAGQMADGNGAKAVQKVAFTPRFGDLPAVYYSGGGRMAVQLLGYTINSYKLYASLWGQAQKGNVAPLLTYHAMSGFVGGGLAAGLPKGLEEIIKLAVPQTEEWFDQNKGAMSDLVQPGNINRIAVGADVATRQGNKAVKLLKSGKEKFQDGDTMGGVFDLAESGLATMSLTNHWTGDVNLQKALKLGRDVAEGETSMEDLPGEAAERYGFK